MAYVAWIVANLELTKPVSSRHIRPEPWRVIGQGKHANALRRQMAICARQKCQKHSVRVVIEAGQVCGTSLPLLDRNFQGFGIFLKVVIYDGK